MVPDVDGCTLSPDGTWKWACDIHDLDYPIIRKLRKASDVRLRDNIASEEKKWFGIIKPSWIAPIYYYAVRIFGRFYV